MPLSDAEYLLKSDLPPALLVSLNELTIRTQSPAWAFIADDGWIRYWGGALAHYGVTNVRGDRQAADQFAFLCGLLPLEGESLRLPRIEINADTYADIHLFQAQGGTWMLMLDATPEAVEFRRIQQRGYDLSLFWLRPSGTTLEDLTTLFAILELVVLERTPEGKFRLIGGIPEWFEKLYPNSTELLTGENFISNFPFIVNFLEDAHNLWNRRLPSRVRSGPWVETDREGNDWHLEATAICLGQTSLLLIESFKLVYEEIQPILQKARDNNLNFERLNKTREALRRSETRQRALLEAIPDLICRFKRNGEILDYKAGNQLSESTARQDLRGQHLSTLIPSEAADKIISDLLHESFKAASQTNRAQIVEYQISNGGAPQYFEARVVLSGEDEALTTIRDVTEHKLAQEAEMVRRNEQYFRSLIEDSSDVIVVANINGTVRYESPSMQRFLGHKPEDRIGKNGFELVHPDDLPRARMIFAEVQTTPGKVVSTTARLCDIKGNWHYVEAVLRNLVNKPEINGIVISFRDITERRLAEEQRAQLQESLRQSRTMAAMGSLVAGVAHEVRNPLFSLSATLDAFEARTQNQAEHAPYTDVLRSEIKRLSRLMNELLEYGKPFSLNLSPCQLREVIEEAVTNCRRTQKKMDVTIDNQVSRHLPEINVDRQRLKQVFQNLIDNALQHSPDQGVITITASLVEGESGSRMELCVCDHGSGFQNEDLSRILEPFFSRRKGGTGLGLSIVQRFIEAHGGTVTAGNRPAGGAVITVTIPMNLKS